MNAATLDRHLPAVSCDFTSVTNQGGALRIVRVNTTTQDDAVGKFPRRVEFFLWFDRKRDEAGIKNDFEVARLAGLNHSSISAWRSGRQRPTTASLADIAVVLGVSSREIWDEAGFLNDKDRQEMMTPAEMAGVEIIQSSPRLSQAQKNALAAIFLAQERRDREEKLRRLKEQIDLVAAGLDDDKDR